MVVWYWAAEAICERAGLVVQSAGSVQRLLTFLIVLVRRGPQPA